MTKPQGGYVPREQIVVSQIHGDLSQEVVRITVDRMCLILHQHRDGIQRNHDWIAPAGILLSFLLTFVTTDFKEWFLPAATWQAVFVISAVLTAGWLIRSLAKRAKAPTLEDLIQKLKDQR